MALVVGMMAGGRTVPASSDAIRQPDTSRYSSSDSLFLDPYPADEPGWDREALVLSARGYVRYPRTIWNGISQRERRAVDSGRAVDKEYWRRATDSEDVVILAWMRTRETWMNTYEPGDTSTGELADLFIGIKYRSLPLNKSQWALLRLEWRLYSGSMADRDARWAQNMRESYQYRWIKNSDSVSSDSMIPPTPSQRLQARPLRIFDHPITNADIEQYLLDYNYTWHHEPETTNVFFGNSPSMSVDSSGHSWYTPLCRGVGTVTWKRFTGQPVPEFMRKSD